MQNQIEYLGLNEIKSLLNVIDDARDRAIIVLFLNTGILLNELTSLKIDSLDWDKKTLKIEGNRDRVIPPYTSKNLRFKMCNRQIFVKN